MSYSSDNIFAMILKGEIPAAKVYEDEHALAFMDVMPQADGHTLVIPKVEAENFFDIPDESLGHLIVTTRRRTVGISHPFPHHSPLCGARPEGPRPRDGGFGNAPGTCGTHQGRPGGLGRE